MLQLSAKKKPAATVGLEIEGGSLAAAEVAVNGRAELRGAAVAPLDASAFGDGEVRDPAALADALREMFAEHRLAKRVRLGVGNQRVVVRTMRLPAIEDRKEMDAAIRFQAADSVPMPLDDAVLQHQVVGGAPGEDGGVPQVDVMVVAARREMIRSFLEPVRRAGLEPIGIDLSAFGMIRALGSVGAGDDPADLDPSEHPGEEAVLYCNLADVMNLAVAKGRGCLFNRVSSTGLETLTRNLVAERGVSAEQAMQWLVFVGLEEPVESLDGDPQMVADTRRVLEAGSSGLADELRLSLDYYGAQETARRVSRIVLTGPGSAIPGLAGRLRESLRLPVGVSRPAALAAYRDEEAARLTVPFGIALES